MGTKGSRRARPRGSIEVRNRGALRVKVYAGIDPLSGQRRYLTETVPPGPNAAAEAERAMTRLQSQVDEKRNLRTSATVNQLIDKWLETARVWAAFITTRIVR